MSCARLFTASLLLGTLSYAGLALADDAQRYNPFQRFIAPLSHSDNPTTNAGATANSLGFTHPRLRAVLHAADGSLANLDGHVLAQGETALGYTLLAVQDHSAKFRYRQRTITLHVTEDSP